MFEPSIQPPVRPSGYRTFCLPSQTVDPAPVQPAVPQESPKSAGSPWTRRLALLSASLTLSAATGFGAGLLANNQDPAVASEAAAESVVVLYSAGTLDIPTIIEKVEPSIVSIETTVVVRQGRFRGEATGAGTGIVLDYDGHIITNAHVVEGAESIAVTTSDGTKLEAHLLAADSSTDIAVLTVNTTDLQPMTAADSESTTVGETVIAIGNALALDGSLTVTQGIVSAFDRSITIESGQLTGLIQTDAAISSGNSGGPLLNLQGEVVGINTAVASSSTTTQASNVGFAITIAQASEIATSLINSRV